MRFRVLMSLLAFVLCLLPSHAKAAEQLQTAWIGEHEAFSFSEKLLTLGGRPAANTRAAQYSGHVMQELPAWLHAEDQQ